MTKTILVVDDADVIRLLSKRALKAAGYSVIEANSGSSALALLDGRTVSLAVCDFSMPGMNGIEFVNAVRKLPNYSRLRIIMLSAADMKEIIESGRKAGVDAWMTKPFSPSTLVDAVNKLCP